MILISAAQCRAARALLNWSQPELAERCGMHVQTISAFESENSSPTKTTLGKITSTFEQAGIDFLNDKGVSIAESKFYTSYSYADILDDCLLSMKHGEEILFHCADDRRSNDIVMKKLNEIAEKGIRMRATTCAENYSLRPFRDYRILPDDYFKTTQLTVIYGEKFTLNIDKKAQNYTFVTIINKTLNDVMRRQFEYWWKNGKPVPKK
jgi:transcriptional regulator with XRE-family HTH domain